MSLISIILPTYNGEKYLAKAIEACLLQSYKKFELIIVNDCSTDNSLAIAESYAASDNRIRIISNSENQKLPGSLNIGFANAEGDFFTWTSDDNYFASHAIERLATELEKDINTDIVYSSYCFIDEKNNILGTFGGELENLLFKCIIGACFLYRRKVHEVLKGYAVEKFRMEDMDFWLRATSNFRYKFIDDKNLYYYRKQSNSLTFGIYGSDILYKQYKENYINSFGTFFNKIMNAQFSEHDLQLHIELFFEDIAYQKNRNFDLSERVLSYLDHLEKLKELDWSIVHFERDRIYQVLTEKKKRIIGLIINNLVFDNKMLSEKNPSIAAHINKPISWYYREYEVLPIWYKRVGHIIKVLQKNRPFRSLFKNNLIQ